ncbi:TlpA family protein disulfide reductase [Fontibacter flavus]|uniref:TlpA family protein disulfide reductase n=1 Tax=Fontibacter flavus TaxID=654838 RepID=A0ABV6FWX3_9BACT
MKKTIIPCFLALLCLFGSLSCGQNLADNSLDLKDENPQPVLVYGVVSSKEPIEKVTLKYWDYLFDPYIKEPPPIIQETVAERGNPFNGGNPGSDYLFSFKIKDIKKPVYISMGDSLSTFLDLFLVLPGDSIALQLDKRNFTISFSGPAQESFNLQAALMKELEGYRFERPSSLLMIRNHSLDHEQREMIESHNQTFGKKVKAVETLDEKLDHLSEKLEARKVVKFGEKIISYEGLVDKKVLDLLTLDYFGKTGISVLKTFETLYKYPRVEQEREQLKEFFQEYLDQEGFIIPPVAQDESSFHYLQFLESFYKGKSLVDGRPFITLVVENEEGPLRDAILARYMLANRNVVSSDMDLLSLASETVENEPFAEIVRSTHSRNREGSPAFPFVFYDTEGKERKLEDYKGKVLLLDFWFTGCSACIGFKENVLSKLEASIGNMDDVLLLSVSSDKDPKIWKKSLESGRYSPESAIHLNTGSLGGNNSFLGHYNISLYPHVMLIDSDGNLARTGFYKPDAGTLMDEINRLLPEKKP